MTGHPGGCATATEDVQTVMSNVEGGCATATRGLPAMTTGHPGGSEVLPEVSGGNLEVVFHDVGLNFACTNRHPGQKSVRLMSCH